MAIGRQKTRVTARQRGNRWQRPRVIHRCPIPSQAGGFLDVWGRHELLDPCFLKMWNHVESIWQKYSNYMQLPCQYVHLACVTMDVRKVNGKWWAHWVIQCLSALDCSQAMAPLFHPHIRGWTRRFNTKVQIKGGSYFEVKLVQLNSDTKVAQQAWAALFSTAVLR